MVALPETDPGDTKPVLLTVATLVLLEVHVALCVTSCVPPAERFAVAVSCSPVPPRVRAVFPFGAVMVMLVMVLLLTVRVVLAF